jgi:CheY-like chemotaxis protein
LIDELNRLKVDIPVLAITGYGNREMMEELRQKGCDEYLDKPFSDEDLVKRVAALLSKKAI